MDAKGRELIFGEEAYAIISCALEVLNGIGHGLHEKPYENALAVEFRHRGIPFLQQSKFPVMWREVLVGEFIPELVVFDKIIVDTKTITTSQRSNAARCSTICASPSCKSALSSISRSQSSSGNASSSAPNRSYSRSFAVKNSSSIPIKQNQRRSRSASVQNPSDSRPFASIRVHSRLKNFNIHSIGSHFHPFAVLNLIFIS